MLNEEVRKIMTKNPVVVSPQDGIKEVTTLMAEKRLQQLPVVEDGKLVGLITTFDLWKLTKAGENIDSKTVSEVMNTHIIKITPKDKVGTAAELFMDRRFKTLPVVNLRNELKGVITAFDILKFSLTEEYPRPILYNDVFVK